MPPTHPTCSAWAAASCLPAARHWRKLLGSFSRCRTASRQASPLGRAGCKLSRGGLPFFACQQVKSAQHGCRPARRRRTAPAGRPARLPGAGAGCTLRRGRHVARWRARGACRRPKGGRAGTRQRQQLCRQGTPRFPMLKPRAGQRASIAEARPALSLAGRHRLLPRQQAGRERPAGLRRRPVAAAAAAVQPGLPPRRRRLIPAGLPRPLPHSGALIIPACCNTKQCSLLDTGQQATLPAC